MGSQWSPSDEADRLCGSLRAQDVSLVLSGLMMSLWFSQGSWCLSGSLRAHDVSVVLSGLMMSLWFFQGSGGQCLPQRGRSAGRDGLLPSVQ